MDGEQKELGRVSLLHGDLLLFEATQDLFTASSGPEKRCNSTLLTRTAHLALPEIYGKLGTVDGGGAVKKQRALSCGTGDGWPGPMKTGRRNPVERGP